MATTAPAPTVPVPPPAVRPDGIEKVTGTARYVADLARPGTEQQHRNNGRGGKAQLLGRLGRQVGAHQKSERSGKRYGHG